MAPHRRELKRREATTPFALEFGARLGGVDLVALLIHVLFQEAANLRSPGFARGHQDKRLDWQRGWPLRFAVGLCFISQQICS